MDDDEKHNYDVVVIGAGLAGLTAAYNILQRDPNLRVIVLEGRDRVGGRTLSQPMKVAGGKTELFDLGGQWVCPTQVHVYTLLHELGMQTFPQNVSGTKVMRLGDNVIRTYESDIPSFGSWWVLIDFQLFLWKVEGMVPKVSMIDPYSSDLAYELDSLTVGAFCRKHLRTRSAREAIDVAIKATFGTDADRMGMLFFLAYANSAGGVLKLFEAKHAAQDSRVKGGTQLISKKLADLIGRDKIILNQSVTAVDQSSEEGVVIVSYQQYCNKTHKTSSEVKTVKATKVVMTAPPNLVNKVTWSPPLLPLKKSIYDTMQMGHLYKFVVTYEKAYWFEKKYSGEIVTNGGYKMNYECSTGPLSVCYDATSFDGAPAIVGFFGGRTAIEWQHKTREEREEAVTKSLAEHLGPELRSYIAYEEKVWGTDPWAGGCPVNYGLPGTMHAMPYIRAPHGSVHFAGTETATVWTGYMSGAIESGERVMKEILGDLNPDLLKTWELETATEAKRTIRGQILAQPPSTLPWNMIGMLVAVVVAVIVLFW